MHANIETLTHDGEDGGGGGGGELITALEGPLEPVPSLSSSSLPLSLTIDPTMGVVGKEAEGSSEGNLEGGDAHLLVTPTVDITAI